MRFREWLESSWRIAGFPIKMSELRHGKLADWLTTFEHLPNIRSSHTQFRDTLEVGLPGELSIAEGDVLGQAIDNLIPWRKGPLNLFGRVIDTEWRSDFKWARLCSHIQWQNKNVLDIGCGNGYFGFRALDAGARSVVGIDGHLLYALQAALVNWFVRSPNVVVPARFDRDTAQSEFDIVLSMGVVYHQRDADSHLRALFDRCQPGGQVVLESIIADEDILPENRYAGMRNVYLIPRVSTLETKLRDAGFVEPKCVDISTTTIEEQRATKYMPFKSLSAALDPSDNSLTIEGHPAPKRAIVTAHRAN